MVRPGSGPPASTQVHAEPPGGETRQKERNVMPTGHILLPLVLIAIGLLILIKGGAFGL